MLIYDNRKLHHPAVNNHTFAFLKASHAVLVWKQRLLFTQFFIFLNSCFPSFRFFLQVPEYDVASPYLSNNQGDFVSYSLHPSAARSKRDADHYAENAYYKLHTFGTKLHLRLRRNKHLLAPDLKLVRRNGDGRTTSHPAPPNTFYLGHVVTDPSSTVALSNYGGLVSKNSLSLKRSDS